jgi:predicted O-methyltransferase YrrM
MEKLWNENDIKDKPLIIQLIDNQANELDFKQPSDDLSGALLQVIVASKPSGNFLELGTGAGRATAWILQAMDENSKLITVESDAKLVTIARNLLGQDSRLIIQEEMGETVLERLNPASFDVVFADTWPGKYNHLEEALKLVKIGGFYIIDDMLPQANWPDGHDLKVKNLVDSLENDLRFRLLKMEWASGIMILVRVR